MYIECPNCHEDNDMLSTVNFNELITKRETRLKCKHCETEFIVYCGIDKFESKPMNHKVEEENNVNRR